MTKLNDPNSASAPVYCKYCDYLLVGLPESRCPECGNTFDLSEPRTFETTSLTSRRNIEQRNWRCFFIRPIIAVLVGPTLSKNSDAASALIVLLCCLAAGVYLLTLARSHR